MACILPSRIFGATQTFLGRMPTSTTCRQTKSCGSGAFLKNTPSLRNNTLYAKRRGLYRDGQVGGGSAKIALLHQIYATIFGSVKLHKVPFLSKYAKSDSRTEELLFLFCRLKSNAEMATKRPSQGGTRPTNCSGPRKGRAKVFFLFFFKIGFGSSK